MLLELLYLRSLIPGETGPTIAQHTQCKKFLAPSFILIQKRAYDLDCIVEAVRQRDWVWSVSHGF
jgi:hypothetical protein